MQLRRALAAAIGTTFLGGLLALAPIADAEPDGSDETTIAAGPLTVVVHHSPFALEVLQYGEPIVETAARAGLPLLSSEGPLSFALGGRIALQVPLASYGVFVDLPLLWYHATTAEPQGDGSFIVRTTHPGRHFVLRLETDADGAVTIDARLNDTTGVALTGSTFLNDEQQRFLGFGERSETPDQTGRVVEQWNEEGPFSAGLLRPLTDPIAGEEWQGPPPLGPATNYSMPWFVSNRGYGFLLDSTWLNRFNLTSERTWQVTTAEPAARYRIYAGPTPAAVLERATTDPTIGRQPPPAEWFFGPWYQPTGSDEFRRNLVEAWRTPVEEGGLDVPVTVSQTYTHYLPCRANASGKEPERAQLYHDWGYRVTTYVNSFVCYGHRDFAEGDANGYFVQIAPGVTYPLPYLAYLDDFSGVIDFTRPGAAEYWHGMLQEALDDGYDGWMEDFGEFVPPDAVLANGRSGLAEHNVYCTRYHAASHELTWPQKGEDFAQFVRCGYTGTGPVARIVWGGDPTEDDSEADGLAAAVNQGLSMGLSGIGYWGSDIGGFHSLVTVGRTDPELMVRWLEVGAFSGIMRTQAEGYPRPFLQDLDRAEIWEPEVLPFWRDLARLRTQLFPYIWEAAQDYQETGMPMMRHLALAFPDSPVSWGQGALAADNEAARFEWMFGDDLLVAPVVDMGATGRDVWLPPGEWVNLWDNVTYDPVTGSYDAAATPAPVLAGGQVVHVDSPLGRTPLFVRAGTCLPMLPADVDTIDDAAGFAHDDRVVTLSEGIDRIRELPFAATC